MRLLKGLLIGLGSLLLLIILALLLIPILFKSQIADRMKKEINANLNATVDFTDYDVSLLWTFPRLTVSFDDLSIIGKGAFENDTFIYVEDAKARLDFWNFLVNKDYTVKSLEFQNPRIFARVDTAGNMNWNITKSDSTSGNGEEVELAINKYEIKNGYLIYDDRYSDTYIKAVHIDHTGSGDFTLSEFELDTRTTADSLTVNYAGIDYIHKAKTEINTTLLVDQDNLKYTFTDGDVVLNGLSLVIDGFVQVPAVGTSLDLSFSAEQADFKKLLSLIPSVFTNDFDEIKSSGLATVKGYVKGENTTATDMPAYGLDIEVTQGSMQFPDMPKSLENVNLTAHITKPQGSLNLTTIDIPQGRFSVGGAPFQFSLLLRSLLSDPFIDATANGKINLSDVASTWRLPPGTQLSGMVDVQNIRAKGNISNLEAGDYRNFVLEGEALLQGVKYADAQFPQGALIRSAHFAFSPSYAAVSGLDMNLGKSDFSGSGRIDNLLPFIVNDATLKGSLNTQSNLVDLNEWLVVNENKTVGNQKINPTEKLNSPPTTDNFDSYAIPANIDFTTNATIAKLIYDNVELKQVKGQIHIHDERLDINSLQGNVLDGTASLSGYYSTKNTKRPDINMEMHVKDMGISNAFQTFHTMQFLVPVAKYLDGRFTTDVNLKGKLGDDLMPDLTTLSGDAFALVINAKIDHFAPLKKLAERLQINALQQIDLSTLKTWFSFDAGRVAVEPFSLNVAGINMDIEGSHGFDQSLAYTIAMEVPREKLGPASSVLDELSGQAARLGLNIAQSEVLKFDVLISGTITNPKLTIGLKDAIQAEKEKLVEEVKDKIKDEITKKVNKEVLDRTDSTKIDAQQTVEEKKKDIEDSIKQSAEDKLKDIIKKRWP